MPSVLIVESDLEFAASLNGALSNRGVDARVIDDANAAIESITQSPPDLVLLCAELPKLSGFSVCNRLRREPALAQLPIIITSSESSEETFDRHRRLPRKSANEYFHKPIEVNELSERVLALLGVESAQTAAADSPAAPCGEPLMAARTSVPQDRPPPVEPFQNLDEARLPSLEANAAAEEAIPGDEAPAQTYETAATSDDAVSGAAEPAPEEMPRAQSVVPEPAARAPFESGVVVDAGGIPSLNNEKSAFDDDFGDLIDGPLDDIPIDDELGDELPAARQPEQSVILEMEQPEVGQPSVHSAFVEQLAVPQLQGRIQSLEQELSEALARADAAEARADAAEAATLAADESVEQVEERVTALQRQLTEVGRVLATKEAASAKEREAAASREAESTRISQEREGLAAELQKKVALLEEQSALLEKAKHESERQETAILELEAQRSIENAASRERERQLAERLEQLESELASERQQREEREARASAESQQSEGRIRELQDILAQQTTESAEAIRALEERCEQLRVTAEQESSALRSELQLANANTLELSQSKEELEARLSQLSAENEAARAAIEREADARLRQTKHQYEERLAHVRQTLLAAVEQLEPQTTAAEGSPESDHSELLQAADSE